MSKKFCTVIRVFSSKKVNKTNYILNTSIFLLRNLPTITIEDLSFPDGVTPVGEPDWAVVTVLTMSTPVLDAEDAAAEEAAEAADGEAAEGDDDAAPADDAE